MMITNATLTDQLYTTDMFIYLGLSSAQLPADGISGVLAHVTAHHFVISNMT